MAHAHPAIGTREWFAIKDALPCGGREWTDMGLREMAARRKLPGDHRRPKYFPWEIEEGNRLAAEIDARRGQ